MPAVLVHGVPESAAVWDDLRARLGRDDVVALSPPGLGSERPPGFGATKDDYAGWLIDELADLGEPVDLVGHDVGGALTLRVAALRGDLLRSWASDALYLFDPRYRWHRYAVRWQTAEVGERDVSATLATPVATRAGPYEAWGLSPRQAQELASWFDETMGTTMLDFYRSAVHISDEWAPSVGWIVTPGLALLPRNDPFANEELVVDVARRHDIAVAAWDGLGHWWMLQDPDRTARTLVSFWASLA